MSYQQSQQPAGYPPAQNQGPNYAASPSQPGSYPPPSQPGGYPPAQQPNYSSTPSQPGGYPPPAQQQQQQSTYGSQQQPQYAASRSSAQQQTGQLQHTQPPPANPYGQNQHYQQHDQQQYQQQQQQQQGYPPQHQAYGAAPYGAPQGEAAAGAQVFTAADVPLGPPPGLVAVTATKDRYTLTTYSLLLLICLGVCGFVAVSCSFSLIATVDIFNIVFLVLALVSICILAVVIFEETLVFNHDTRTASINRKRLFQHFADPEAVTVVPYADLGEAGYTGSPGVQGELYIELGTTRLILARRFYQTQAQILSELEPWRRYLEQKRGRPTVAGAVGAFIHAVASAV